MGKNRNWANPQDYEFMKEFSPERWAWEFLRRNPGYIQEWEKELPLELDRIKEILSDPDTKDAPYLEGYRTNTPDSTHFIIPGESLNKYFEKWGILNLVNPEQDTPFPNPFHQFTSYELGTVKGGNIGWRRDNSLDPYVSVIFDLTRPLKPQFANAQKRLMDIQKHKVKTGKLSLRTVRKQKELWIEYLRVWDAKAQNVRNDTIAEVIFSNLSNEYPDYQGNEKVRKSFKQAKYLIEKGYREIAMTY